MITFKLAIYDILLQTQCHRLQISLGEYRNEAKAKLLTSLSADGSIESLDKFKQLKSDMASLASSGNPWTITLETDDYVTRAAEIKQSLEKLKSQVSLF